MTTQGFPTARNQLRLIAEERIATEKLATNKLANPHNPTIWKQFYQDLNQIQVTGEVGRKWRTKSQSQNCFGGYGRSLITITFLARI